MSRLLREMRSLEGPASNELVNEWADRLQRALSTTREQVAEAIRVYDLRAFAEGAQDYAARLHDIAQATEKHAERVKDKAPPWIISALRDDARFLHELADQIEAGVR